MTAWIIPLVNLDMGQVSLMLPVPLYVSKICVEIIFSRCDFVSWLPALSGQLTGAFAGHNATMTRVRRVLLLEELCRDMVNDNIHIVFILTKTMNAWRSVHTIIMCIYDIFSKQKYFITDIHNILDQYCNYSK